MTDEEIKLQIFTEVLAVQYIAAPHWARNGLDPGKPDLFLEHAAIMMVKGFEKFKEYTDGTIKSD